MEKKHLETIILCLKQRETELLDLKAWEARNQGSRQLCEKELEAVQEALVAIRALGHEELGK